MPHENQSPKRGPGLTLIRNKHKHTHTPHPASTHTPTARLQRFGACFELMDDVTRASAHTQRTPAYLLTDLAHLAAVEGRTDVLQECIQRLAKEQQQVQVGLVAGSWAALQGSVRVGECVVA